MVGYTGPMDLLSDVLSQSGLRKHLLRHRMIFEPWAMKFPCDRSIGFHVVTQGEAFLRLRRAPDPVRLGKGDIVLLARGFEHELATDPAHRVDDPRVGEPVGVAGKTPLLTLVSGLYQFWNEPIHPLFRELPEQVILSADSIAAHDPVHTALHLLSLEAAKPGLGTETVTRALLDILFSYLIRNLVTERAGQSRSWCQAVADPQIAKVLSAMHTEWARDWGLAELAHQGGMSRASLAQKFKRSMGDTPLRYLTTIRMQRAMELLSTSGLSVEQVAHAVGYSDAFGFSKTFKRLTGQAPRDFRSRFLAEERQRSPGSS